MKWWKKALVWSGIWSVLIAIGVLFMLHRIEKEASSPAHREAWEEKLANSSGLLFGLA